MSESKDGRRWTRQPCVQCGFAGRYADALLCPTCERKRPQAEPTKTLRQLPKEWGELVGACLDAGYQDTTLLIIRGGRHCSEAALALFGRILCKVGGADPPIMLHVNQGATYRLSADRDDESSIHEVEASPFLDWRMILAPEPEERRTAAPLGVPAKMFGG